MRAGVLNDALAPALADADVVACLAANLDWRPDVVLAPLRDSVDVVVADTVSDLVEAVSGRARPGDRILVMSNGGFEGVHQRLLDALDSRS
jgi:UDP-N-acetylmuramate: L-alanyl-gamma-D-glutamyl-meso-diaminopimelate ligase